MLEAVAAFAYGFDVITRVLAENQQRREAELQLDPERPLEPDEDEEVL